MSNAFLLRLCSIGLAMVLAGCTDHRGEIVRSPSGQYGAFATVNRSDSTASDHRAAVIHLVDRNGNELSSIKPGASDVQKWALGWMHETDIVVLHSSDIGPRAFRAQGVGLVAADVDVVGLRRRACELYEEKYGELSNSCRKILESL